MMLNSVVAADASMEQRLAEYVVLAYDPALRDQAADFWETSRPHYQAVVTEILAGASPLRGSVLRRSPGRRPTGRSSPP